MKNWKITPQHSTVANYINCYWFIEKSRHDTGPDFPKLNPDPAGHLIISDPLQTYHYANESEIGSGRGSHLILPYRKTLSMDHSGPFLIFGIKFQVGALYALKFPTARPLLDQVIRVDVAQLFQLEDFHETKTLAQKAAGPETWRDQFDRLLAPCLSEIRENKHSKLVRQILDAFSHTPLSGLGTALGCSQRTIERSFLRVTGLTLKQYQSMNRLEAILDYLHKLNPTEMDWADIALQFGFSDQPHLTRYLKHSIGSTPGTYARKRDLAIDAYGNFE